MRRPDSDAEIKLYCSLYTEGKLNSPISTNSKPHRLPHYLSVVMPTAIIKSKTNKPTPSLDNKSTEKKKEQTSTSGHETPIKSTQPPKSQIAKTKI